MTGAIGGGGSRKGRIPDADVSAIRDKIRIRRDHVIEAMVEQLGGHVDLIEAPFDPEAGAYAGGHTHSHDDDDDHDHGHTHSHPHV